MELVTLNNEGKYIYDTNIKYISAINDAIDQENITKATKARDIYLEYITKGMTVGVSWYDWLRDMIRHDQERRKKIAPLEFVMMLMLSKIPIYIHINSAGDGVMDRLLTKLSQPCKHSTICRHIYPSVTFIDIALTVKEQKNHTQDVYDVSTVEYFYRVVLRLPLLIDMELPTSLEEHTDRLRHAIDALHLEEDTKEMFLDKFIEVYTDPDEQTLYGGTVLGYFVTTQEAITLLNVLNEITFSYSSNDEAIIVSSGSNNYNIVLKAMIFN